MVILNKSITVNGASVFKEGEKEVQAAYMSASIPMDGRINVTRAIQNKKMFEENKEEVLKDFAAFDNYVYGLLSEGDTAGE